MTTRGRKNEEQMHGDNFTHTRSKNFCKKLSSIGSLSSHLGLLESVLYKRPQEIVYFSPQIGMREAYLQLVNAEGDYVYPCISLAGTFDAVPPEYFDRSTPHGPESQYPTEGLNPNDPTFDLDAAAEHFERSIWTPFLRDVFYLFVQDIGATYERMWAPSAWASCKAQVPKRDEIRLGSGRHDAGTPTSPRVWREDIKQDSLSGRSTGAGQSRQAAELKADKRLLRLTETLVLPKFKAQYEHNLLAYEQAYVLMMVPSAAKQNLENPDRRLFSHTNFLLAWDFDTLACVLKRIANIKDVHGRQPFADQIARLRIALMGFNYFDFLNMVQVEPRKVVIGNMARTCA